MWKQNKSCTFSSWLLDVGEEFLKSSCLRLSDNLCINLISNIRVGSQPEKNENSKRMSELNRMKCQQKSHVKNNWIQKCSPPKVILARLDIGIHKHTRRCHRSQSKGSCSEHMNWLLPTKYLNDATKVFRQVLRAITMSHLTIKKMT